MTIQLPVSAREIVRFTPTGHEGEDNPPIYLLKVPSLLERSRWRRDVKAEGVRLVTRSDLLAALRTAVVASGGERATEWLAVIDRASVLDEFSDVQGDDAAALTELEAIVARAVPSYAAMLADRQFYIEVAPIVALRGFLTGWENGPDGRTRSGRFSDDDLLMIPEVDRLAVGWHAIGLMSLDRATAKNSVSPSPSA